MYKATYKLQKVAYNAKKLKKVALIKKTCGLIGHFLTK